MEDHIEAEFEEIRREINKDKGPNEPKIPPLSNKNWKPAILDTVKLGIPIKAEGIAVVVSDDKAYFFTTKSGEVTTALIVGTELSAITFK